MKPILAFVIFAVLAAAVRGQTNMKKDEIKEFIKARSEECKQDNTLTEDDISSLRERNVPTTASGKCFVDCMFEKLGMMENGQFSPEKSLQTAADVFTDDSERFDIAKKMIDGCKAEVGTSEGKCEAGPKLFLCLKKTAEGLDILPED